MTALYPATNLCTKIKDCDQAVFSFRLVNYSRGKSNHRRGNKAAAKTGHDLGFHCQHVSKVNIGLD